MSGEPVFEGGAYRLASNWYEHIPFWCGEKPLKYLELGTFCGANLFSVARSYGAHPDAELHCIDPWLDYEEYPEYKGEQDGIYRTFRRNLERSGVAHKVCVHRGFSSDVVPKFDDEYFDMIYVDGNHEPEYVLEDAVLAFRKLKRGGYLIFDDYGWGGPDLTQRGIDAFLSAYHKRVVRLGMRQSQVFVRKI